MEKMPSTSQRLDVIFAALADSTRRAILARLAAGQASVHELSRPFAMSQPAISKHLKVLERAGLISRGQDRQRRPRRLEAKRLKEATEWLERYRQLWEVNFQRLDTLLDELNAEELATGELKNKEKKQRRSKRRRRKSNDTQHAI
jgi:DNA-binding transcriptional ArsR family regulator